MSECFGVVDFWTNVLCKLDYEVWEPVGNAEFMKKVWAQENRVSLREDYWLDDVVMALS